MDRLIGASPQAQELGIEELALQYCIVKIRAFADPPKRANHARQLDGSLAVGLAGWLWPVTRGLMPACVRDFCVLVGLRTPECLSYGL